jgi:gliding motility-associated-like protein
MKVTPLGIAKSLWLFLLLFVSFKAGASHIVGGEVTYQCLGNNYYRVVVTMFRDCSGVIMQPTTNLTIRRGNNSWDTVVFIPKGPSSFINVSKSGCGMPTPNVCIETADYVLDSIYLPPSASGYHLYNQGCCRNYNVNNIVNAWKVGSTFASQIFGTGGGCNSSPSFNQYPPVVLPANVPLAVNVSATDPDSDSLSYDLCAPLDDDNFAPPFVNVPFATGYSSSNLVPASPPLTINSSTGLISGTITAAGKYSVGICITEWKNGVIVGTVRRDYQFTVIQPWAVFASVGAQADATCATVNNGSATIAVGGGQAPYTFAWSDNGTGATRNNLAAGTYSVIVTDNTGCKDTVTVVIGSSPGFTASITNQTSAGCGNSGGGSATIAVTGGTPPYTITWPDNSTGFTHNNLTAGTHAVVVNDAGNCPDTIVVNIAAVASTLAATGVVTDEYCAGSLTGKIDVSVTSGNAPFTFLWNDAITTEDRTGLAAGHYWVAVTDNGGCTDTLHFTVNSGAGISASFDSIKEISCAGASDGYLSATAGNAMGGLKYLWSNSSTAASIGGLSAGLYWVVITDSVGCKDSIVTVINVPDTLKVNVQNLVNVSCFGLADGSISLAVQGGKAPYTYSWNNSASTSSINRLTAGNYTVNITDANGCKVRKVIKISQPAALQLSLKNLTHENCNGGNGAISIGITGGSKPYNINWSNAQTDSTLQNLNAGNYTVTITDSNGCRVSASYTINPASPLNLNVDSVSSANCGLTNGYASILVSGGVVPYTINWSNAQTGPMATNLPGGSIYAVVSDSVGCIDTIHVTIPNAAGLSIALDSMSAPNCAGGHDGFARIHSTGGVAPLSFTWSNGAQQSFTDSLPSGNGYVIVVDAKGCRDSLSFTVPATTPLHLQADILKQVTCAGAQNGKISISLSGGTPPYSYSWTTGDTISTLNKLGSGSYGVTVTDSRACSISATYTITAPDSMQLSLKSLKDAACYGASNGEIAVSIKGGTKPYAITWSNSQTDSTALNLSAGSYSIMVIDSNGCSVSDSFVVAEPAALALALDTAISASCGQANGSATVNVSGGSGTATVSWSNSQTGLTATGLVSGTYTAIATDSLGCTDTLHLNISNGGNLVASLDSTAKPACAGATNGYAIVSATGGTAPYSYQWSNGDTTSATHNLSAGVAWVIVADSRGCSDSISFILQDADSLTLAVDTLKQVTCAGAQNGKISISLLGGTPPYSYSWTTGDTISTLNKLGSGSYGVTVTDSRACSISATYTITAPDSMQLSLKSLKDAACYGASNGEIAVSIKGGTKPYAITWSNSQTDSTALNLSAGSYSITVVDSNGCSVTDSFVVAEPAALLMAIDSVTTASCGQNNGSAGVVVSGGTAPYTFSWSSGSTSDTANALGSGIYSVVVIDSLGCTDSLSVTIPNAGNLTVALDSLVNVSCFNGTDGYLEVSPSGGVAPYSYLWSNGDTTKNLTHVGAGNYSLTVSDNSGCTVSASYTITQNDSLELKLKKLVNAGCDTANGQIAIGIAGGLKPYSIVWSNSQTDSIVANLTSGNYTVWITDAAGCSDSATYTITQPAGVSLQLDTVISASCGASNGSATLQVVGGVAPFNVQWSNTQVGITATNLPAGTYTAVVTDSNGCKDSVVVMVPNSGGFNAVLDSLVDPACGWNNGYGSVQVSGATGSVQYYWSNGDTTAITHSLPSGTGFVLITDNLGCSDSLSFNLAPTDSLQIKLDSLNHVNCHKAFDGKISISVTGGTPPYSFSWTNGDTISTLNKLGGGSYGVTVTDSRACSISATYVITEPDSLQLSLKNITHVSCNGANDGQIEVSVKGGAAPYSVLWSNAQTDSTAANLFAGSYIVYITDAFGCEVTDTFRITQPDTLGFVVDSILPASCGQANGYIEVTGFGGTSPYTFEWNTGQRTAEEDSLIARLYTVKIKDVNGCEYSEHVNVPATSPFAAQIDSVIAPTCFGFADGKAAVSGSGGTPPYSFSWMNGDTTALIQNLSSGPAYVVVIDARGCKDSIQVIVPVKDSMVIVLDTMANPLCSNGNDGLIHVSVTGGNPPYSYSWSNNVATNNNTGLAAGIYSLLVTDSKGCNISSSYTLIDPTPLQLSLKSVTDASCFGGNDGQLHIAINGGNAPYSITWNVPRQDSIITGLTAGTYTATVSDANGCSITDSFIVAQPSAISITAINTTTAGCGLPNGSATVSVSGGSGVYSTIWDNGETGMMADSLIVGLHTVWVYDSSGCVDSLQITIPNAQPLQVVADSVKAPTCHGGSDGFASAVVSGGVAPYTFMWNNAINQPANFNLQSGTATLVVTDAIGCTDSIALWIPVTDSIRIQLDSVHHVLCYGDPSAFLEISVDGGTKPYAINWSNNAAGKVLQNSKAGIYTVTVTDSNGCMNAAVFEITEPDTFYVIVDSVKNVTCTGADDGAVYLRASNGHVISAIQANRGKVGSSNVSQLAAGKYSFWVENTNGCGTTVDFEIRNPAPIKVSEYKNVSPRCDEEKDGIVELTASGGNGAPYFFVWDDGVTNANRYDLAAGRHTVMVTDVKGCVTQKDIYVAPKKLAMDFRLDEVGCSEQADARLVVNVDEATLPYALYMNGVRVGQNQKVMAGNYVLTLVDADSCSVSKKMVVEPNRGSNLFFASAFTPNGDGLNDTYELKGSDECLTNARFEIYTRWGGKVFSTDRPFEEYWDGTINGQPAKADIYMYNFISDEKQETGYLNVLK